MARATRCGFPRRNDIAAPTNLSTLSAANEEIAPSMESISAVTKESTQGAEQAAQAATQLSQQAEKLQAMVAKFRV